MPRRLLIDCDPGQDDAVALLLAAASDELDLARVTVTHGNVGLPHTLDNALRVLALAGRTVPVHPGADRPLVRPPLRAGHIHGEGGLGGVTLPAPTQVPEALPAALAIVQEARAHPGLTLVATGPLSNVALALRLEPRLPALLAELVLMGGSLDHGNATPAAEFNALADPHAARMVFEAAAQSGLNLSMFGLNATRAMTITPEREALLRAVGTRAAAACADILADARRRLEARGRRDQRALHDPCTVAFLIRPELFELRPLRVWVDDVEGSLDFGRTLVDVNGVSGEPPNAQVAVRVDADGVYALLAERLARLP